VARRERLAHDRVAAEMVQHDSVTYETGRAADVDPSGVETRTDFAHFLSAVLADFRATGVSEWENGTLDRFLEAFAAVAEARIKGVPEQHHDHGSWRIFAEIVQAATGYE
jgi:hypothetical protein